MSSLLRISSTSSYHWVIMSIIMGFNRLMIRSFRKCIHSLKETTLNTRMSSELSAIMTAMETHKLR